MKKLTTTLILILVIILVGTGLYYNFGHGLMSKHPKLYGADVPDGVIKGYLQDVIPHHIEAVNISKTIMEDPAITIPEVRLLAARIADAEEFEIGQMKGWYAEWFGVHVPVFLYQSTLTKTDATGDARAKIYLRDMLKHARYEANKARIAHAYIAKMQKNSSSSDGDLTITNSHPGIDTALMFTKDIEAKKLQDVADIEALLKKF